MSRPTPSGRLRLLARVSTMALALAVALLFHGIWRLFRLPSPWPRLLLASIAWIAGARRRTTGTPLRRDVVFVANHLSWVDILLLAGVTGTAFVAKAELADVPLVGWLCRRNRTLFVARGDRMGVQRQVEQLRAMLADGWTVAIFPEGTTGDGETLLPFKPTLLAALDAAPTGLRVQPVRIDYGAATREIAWVGEEPGRSHVARILARPGSFDGNLTFLDPFAPTGGRKVVAAEARARIAAAIDRS